MAERGVGRGFRRGGGSDLVVEAEAEAVAEALVVAVVVLAVVEVVDVVAGVVAVAVVVKKKNGFQQLNSDDWFMKANSILTMTFSFIKSASKNQRFWIII
eukprot:604079_1